MLSFVKCNTCILRKNRWNALIMVCWITQFNKNETNNSNFFPVLTFSQTFLTSHCWENNLTNLMLVNEFFMSFSKHSLLGTS